MTPPVYSIEMLLGMTAQSRTAGLKGGAINQAKFALLLRGRYTVVAIVVQFPCRASSCNEDEARLIKFLLLVGETLKSLREHSSRIRGASLC